MNRVGSISMPKNPLLIRSGYSRGFTVIELMLAMTFVSILLLMVAATVIQLSTIYNKGMTMKAVDQAGRALSADIRQVLAKSQPSDIDVHLLEQSEQGFIYGGRLCTGLYSYIWNYGRALTQDDQSNKKNTYDSSGSEIRFVRVRDTGGQYCSNPTSTVTRSDATEMLSTDGANLAVQSFEVNPLAEDRATGQALYQVVMEIGTNDQDALQREGSLDTIITSCKPPSDALSQDDFCAVNQFDFTAQVGNKGEL